MFLSKEIYRRPEVKPNRHWVHFSKT